MRLSQLTVLAGGVLWMSLLHASAQTEPVTQTNIVTVVVTNVVTLTQTNVVTVTNVVPPAPPGTPAVAATEVKKYPWDSSVSAGLTMTRGNSHTLLYSGTFQTAKKTPENEFQFGAKGAYGSQDSQANVNNYGGYGQWNHLFTERFYVYVRVEALRDVISDLDYRFNVGPGLGYYLVKETNTTLSVEGGAGMQYQHLGNNYSSYGTLRGAENFEHKFNGFVRIWEKAEILPQLDKYQNYVVNAEIGLESSLTKTLALKTYLDDTYQSEPASGRVRNDVKLVTAVAYKF
jgi:putative salt-induced outer membrane protein YdiY